MARGCIPIEHGPGGVAWAYAARTGMCFKVQSCQANGHVARWDQVGKCRLMSLSPGLIGNGRAGCPGHPGTLAHCDEASLHQHSGPYFPYCIGLFWCEEEKATHYSPRSLSFRVAPVVLFGGQHAHVCLCSFVFVCVLSL